MRALSVTAIALLLGAVVSFFVARSLSGGSEAIHSVPVVVAAQAIEPGTRLNALQLNLVEWPVLSRPAGAFADVNALAGRVVRSGLQAGEPLTEGRLAATEARGGLASIITPGKRAVSVRVNDVVGVAGFALPGSYVDVIVSARDAGEKPFARTVLSRVRVLAAAQDTWADPAKPKLVNAVTLELSPEEAERLDLARTVGNLSLVLRNEFDDGAVAPGERSGARLDDLVASAAPVATAGVAGNAVRAPRPPRPRTGEPSAAAPAVGPPVNAVATARFEEIRGTHRVFGNGAIE
ncbi:MAG: Flp pilus assembly protein CpaB [Rhodocyclaceae bacterium]|nr:Flp pilus assembly protein CpaB [Rhodocyclaceae bacterium]